MKPIAARLLVEALATLEAQGFQVCGDTATQRRCLDCPAQNVRRRRFQREDGRRRHVEYCEGCGRWSW